MSFYCNSQHIIIAVRFLLFLVRLLFTYWTGSTRVPFNRKEGKVTEPQTENCLFCTRNRVNVNQHERIKRVSWKYSTLVYGESHTGQVDPRDTRSWWSKCKCPVTLTIIVTVGPTKGVTWHSGTSCIVPHGGRGHKRYRHENDGPSRVEFVVEERRLENFIMEVQRKEVTQVVIF